MARGYAFPAAESNESRRTLGDGFKIAAEGSGLK